MPEDRYINDVKKREGQGGALSKFLKLHNPMIKICMYIVYLIYIKPMTYRLSHNACPTLCNNLSEVDEPRNMGHPASRQP